MTKARADLHNSKEKIHLRYIRLPNNITEFLDDCLFRSEKIIACRSQVTSQHSVAFDGRTVLAAGFPIVYFEFPGRWFSILKVWNKQGERTGYYCDVVTPLQFLDRNKIELTDLFLDLWVSPDLRYKVLDEDELEEAFHKGWITKELYEKAGGELKRLILLVERKKFPPPLVKELEKKLGL